MVLGFEIAKEYVKERQQFGAPLANLQSVQFKLVCVQILFWLFTTEV